MSRILVALDGSTLAEQALPYARAYAKEGEEILLVRIVELSSAHVLLEPYQITNLLEDVQGLAREYLDSVASRLRSEGFRVDTRVIFGEAKDELPAAAERERARLIVLTSRGLTGLSRWLMGSVAEGVVRRAPCPVCVIPTAGDEGRKPTLENILLPLDLSELSEQTVTYALTLPVGRRVLLYSAIDVSGNGKIRELAGELSTKVRAYLETQAELFRERGWKAECIVQETRAAEGIVDTAEDEDIDLVVMSTHGRNGTDRWLTGSVAEKVMRHSPCPVTLIRPLKVGAELETAAK